MTASCGHQVAPDELIWLGEDDETVCPHCHTEDLRDDMLDRFDHGYAYRVDELKGAIHEPLPR